MKLQLIWIFSCLLLLNFFTSLIQADHSVSWGARAIGDNLLKREEVSRRARFLRRRRGEFIYEQKDYIGYPKIVTFVKVTDQYGRNGGYASLTEGGPGQTSVKLNFISKGWRGFNFLVEVYGI